MAARSWFYASEGQQQGPYPEIQIRELIARGTITADTLVWTEGMANWQRADEIPGLAPGASGPPAMPRSSGAVPSAGGYRDGPLSIDFGILEFVWRSLVLLIGLVLVIPAPWVLVWYIQWLVPCVHVPGRPNLGFTGHAMTLVPWYLGAVALSIGVAFTGIELLSNLMFLVQFALYWLFIKWLIANLASNGQPLGLSFSGSFWAFLGWSILAVVSVITIIGWAWVYAAMTRWICRNIRGTRREVVFTGTGLEFLWRTVLAAIGSFLLIPIPWVYRWMWRWLASQTKLVERGAQAQG